MMSARLNEAQPVDFVGDEAKQDNWSGAAATKKKLYSHNHRLRRNVSVQAGALSSYYLLKLVLQISSISLSLAS